MLVMVLVFGMTVLGCDDGSKNNGDGIFTVNLSGFDEYAGEKINIRIGSSSSYFYFLSEEDPPVIDQSGKATFSKDFWQDFTIYFIIEIYTSSPYSTFYKSKEQYTIKESGGRLDLSIDDFEPYDN